MTVLAVLVLVVAPLGSCYLSFVTKSGSHSPRILCALASATLAASACLADEGLGEASSDGATTTTSGTGATDTLEDESTDSETGQTDELGPEDLAEIDMVASELEMIVAGALAYFALEQPEPPLHRCPHPNGSPLGGEAGFTPDLGFDCNASDTGKCVPVFAGGGAGQYDMALWLENSVWMGVGWMREEGVAHEFHYNLLVQNTSDDACSFTAMARADFDDDGEFSTYSISGTVDESGAIVDPLVVELPFE